MVYYRPMSIPEIMNLRELGIYKGPGSKTPYLLRPDGSPATEPFYNVEVRGMMSNIRVDHFPSREPINYDKSVFQGGCYGSYNLGSGTNICDLTVKSDADFGRSDILIDGKVAEIEIIQNPNFLVVTNSQKLG